MMARENPYNYNLPTPPEDFVGRWPLVERIVADLCRARPDSWAVIGGRRFGKSSVLKAVEARLLARLAEAEPGERYILPLIVDIKGAGTAGEGNVYARIVRLLRRAMRRGLIPSVAPPADLEMAARENSLPFYRFEEVLESLWDHLDEKVGPARLVLLLDEAEAVVRFPWAETLFNQLRSLVYDGLLADFVRLVLTGASRVIRARHEGSPLLNMVNVEHLEIISERAMDELIARGGGMVPPAAAEVKAQSGGHPFIAQYLLHHLWDGDLAQVTAARVKEVAHQMRWRRAEDLRGWWEAVGDGGQRAYALLAEAQEWVDERTLLTEIKGAEQPVDQGLAALCYHGLVMRERDRYRVAGALFRDWFRVNASVSSVSPSAERGDVQSSAQLSKYNIHIEHAEGIAIGDKAQVVSSLSKPTSLDSSVRLGQMDTKLDALREGQEAIRGDLSGLRGDLLARFDAGERALLAAWTERLDETNLEAVTAILDALEGDTLSRREMAGTLTAVREALTALQQSEAQLPRQAHRLQEVVDAPHLDVQHKLRVAIPIIPVLLTYEGEIGLGSGADLEASWHRLVERVKGGRGK